MPAGARGLPFAWNPASAACPRYNRGPVQPTLYSFHLPLVGEVTFPAYFTLLTIGFGVALWMTWRESKRIGLDPDLIIDTNLWMVIWGIIGARVLHLVADGHFHEYVDLCVDPTRVKAIDALVAHCTADAQCGYDYVCDLARNVCHPPRDCLAAIKVWRGGLAYYGGFLFAVAFGVHFVRRNRMPLGRVADLSAPAIAFGLFFGRMGCFFNGCCYGKLTPSRLGLVFPRGGYAWRAQLDAGLIHAADEAHAVHPTQLYEAIACLAISAILYFVVRPNKRRDGDVWAGLLVLYAIARSVIEAFRDDDRGVFFGGHVSTSQLISIPLALAGVALMAYTRRSPGSGAAPSSSAAA
jgi:phosphatidylglycerol:prolipoprotein diacylglycerol transferase